MIFLGDPLPPDIQKAAENLLKAYDLR